MLSTIHVIQKMGDTKNFEAIGRYHDALEQVNVLTIQRHNLAGRISGLLRDAGMVDGLGTSIRKFNHDAVIDGEVASLVRTVF